VHCKCSTTTMMMPSKGLQSTETELVWSVVVYRSIVRAVRQSADDYALMHFTTGYVDTRWRMLWRYGKCIGEFKRWCVRLQLWHMLRGCRTSPWTYSHEESSDIRVSCGSNFISMSWTVLAWITNVTDRRTLRNCDGNSGRPTTRAKSGKVTAVYGRGA